MKALLLASAFALVLAVPAMAEEHAAPATTAAAPATTYEQAWTECADTTKDAQGDKDAAVKACMSEKGFEVKEESHDQHSALDGLTFADAHAATTTSVTTATDGAVEVTTPGATVTTGAEGTTVTTEAPAADAAATTTTETTVETKTEEHK